MNLLIQSRFSPKKFKTDPISNEILTELFEAARWAPSSRNEQPWRFIYATKENKSEFQKLLGLLDEYNQEWAKDVAVLIVSVVKKNFDYKDRPNRTAMYDVGLAVENLILEAMEHGIHSHQMGGYNYERTISELEIPEGYEPIAFIALGYKDENYPENRERKELSEFVHKGKWFRK